MLPVDQNDKTHTQIVTGGVTERRKRQKKDCGQRCTRECQQWEKDINCQLKKTLDEKHQVFQAKDLGRCTRTGYNICDDGCSQMRPLIR